MTAGEHGRTRPLLGLPTRAKNLAGGDTVGNRAIQASWWVLGRGGWRWAPMALSMEEQRILAEIEQELERSEPVLAACLTMFSRPGRAGLLRVPGPRRRSSRVLTVA